MSALDIERYETYIESVRARGVPLAEYGCPACEASLHTLIPRVDEDRDYTSMAACPYCGRQHFRVTCDDGSVWIRERPGERLREVTR